MIQKKSRIIWVDVVKYICIIMVILSHLEANTDVWNIFYSPFFLSGFFFVAGYVYGPKESFRKTMYKKIRQLFIPWLIFSVFNILLSHLISFNQHENLITELKWNFLQIRGKGDELWFIAALFIAFIPFYYFINWYEKKHKWIVALIISWIFSFASIMYSRLMPAEVFPWNSSSLPWHIEFVFQAMFYMVCGYVFRKEFEEKLDRYNILCIRICVVIIYLMIVFVPYFGGIEFPLIIDVLYDIFQALIGIMAIVMISKTIKSNQYINFTGRNTLIYFALHGKVYSIMQAALKKYAGTIYYLILGNTISSSFFALILSICISIILIVPAYIINKFFPFLIGKSSS